MDKVYIIFWTQGGNTGMMATAIGDEESAKCLFCKYKHCREVYMSVYGTGRKFVDMLVSA